MILESLKARHHQRHLHCLPRSVVNVGDTWEGFRKRVVKWRRTRLGST
jgi:hypothetical protein